MLSEKQIDEYHESLSEYFLTPRRTGIFNINNNLKTIPVLSTTPGGRVIGIANHFTTVETFSDHSKEVISSLWSINNKNMIIPFEKIYKLVYDKAQKELVIDINIKDEKELYNYILIHQKIRYYDQMIDLILYQSSVLNNRLPFNVYSFVGKMFEVNDILNKGIKEDLFQNYPLVGVYAKNRGINLYQAAQEIKFKISCDLVTISELENLQTEFSNILKQENDIKNLPVILRDFENKTFNYARLAL